MKTNFKFKKLSVTAMMLLASVAQGGIIMDSNDLYEVACSKMTVVGSAIGLLVAGGVAATNNTIVKNPLWGLDVSDSNFSGQFACQINNNLAYGQLSGVYDSLNDSISWQIDDWDVPISGTTARGTLTGAGSIDDANGSLSGICELIGELGEVAVHIGIDVIAHEIGGAAVGFSCAVVGLMFIATPAEGAEVEVNEVPVNFNLNLTYTTSVLYGSDIIQNLLGLTPLVGNLDTSTGTFTASPEPATVLLLSLGGLALLRKRRTKS